MRKSRRATLIAMLAAGAALLAPSGAAAETPALDMFEASVDSEQLAELNASGYDVASVEPSAEGAAVELVLSAAERDELSREGISTDPVLDPQGRTVAERAVQQSNNGYRVFRDYDGKGGIEATMRKLANRFPEIAKLKAIGETTQGRDILAMRLTDNSGKGRRKSKPTVLYQGTTHAREWISTEVTLRLMRYFIAKSDKREIKKLLRKNELWFLPVVNPDGYQYTFDTERLWRKNLRDNDGDGEISVGDGVDLNRNYPERWGYDDEGSASVESDETFRGPAAGSEPETKADMKLVEKIDPAFALSYHSFGPLLLYPQGWQVQSPASDGPIYYALTGNDAEPAVKGFDPDVAAELYTTNGEFTDWAHAGAGTLAWTPELNEGCQGCGFVFPDNPKKVKREFRINKQFALDLARSAKRPDRPDSHLGNRTKPMYLGTVGPEPTLENNPDADFRFKTSYGGSQPVQVLARKNLRKVKLSYRINGGPKRTVKTDSFNGGERFDPNEYGVYYEQRRGVVPDQQAGDEVEVWFTSAEKKTRSFTYTVAVDDPADVLIVAAEDYFGASNSPSYAGAMEPSFLDYYESSLDAAGLSYDVYDVDAEGRRAPDALGVLGHYDAVIQYTGNDVVTREPGQQPGTASRLANDEMLELRSYLNEGGKLLYTGQYAGFQYAFGYAFDPLENAACDAGDDEVDARCQLLSDDFLQYYLGAGLYNDDAGTEGGEPLDVLGTASPFADLDWGLNGGTGADNQEHTASFLSTSSLLDEEMFPQFASDAPAAFARTGQAPFEPFEGSKYMFSGRTSNAYKRLSHDFDLRGVAAADATLDFQASYDAEIAYDHVIVEVHTKGQDDWTTLPDANGHTQPDVGESCGIGWAEDLHPFLRHYQTPNGDGTCEAQGTTGEWNSATGRSQGWEDWSIDLSDYAGKQVEVSISYVTDYAVDGLGVFIDDVSTGFGDGTTSFEDDADPLDGWRVPGAPADSPGNVDDWEQSGSVGFEEGAVTSTEDSLYFGFGFEAIETDAQRDAVMQRSMDYLLGG